MIREKIKEFTKSKTTNSSNNRIVNRDGFDFFSEFIKVDFFGRNNIVTIKSISHENVGAIHIIIHGDENQIEIGDDIFTAHYLNINLGVNEQHSVTNVSVVIGNYVRISGLTITTVNSNNQILIGDKCMFASDIEIYNTDGHPIYEKNTRNIINKPGKLQIGNHVWVGQNVIILKNVKIPSGCIVGRNSLVASKKFTEENCVLVGNPARVVKYNIDWDIYDANYIKNSINTK